MGARCVGIADIDDVGIRHLRYFLTLVREGSVSAAADELHIAQPSLSLQLRKLEERVGTQLFVRAARGISLTPAGRRFLDGVENIPAQLRAAAEAAVSAGRDWELGVCSGVPAQVVELVRAALTAPSRAPEAESRASEADDVSARSIHLSSVASARQVVLLEHGELSFGIIRLPVGSPRLIAATVSDEALGVVVGRHHEFADLAAVPWQSVITQRLLWFDVNRAPGYAGSLLSALSNAGWSPELVQPDTSKHILFQHALQTSSDLISLRPRLSVQGDPVLRWRAIEGGPELRERLAVAALRGTDNADVIQAAAEAKSWPTGD